MNLPIDKKITLMPQGFSLFDFFYNKDKAGQLCPSELLTFFFSIQHQLPTSNF